MRCIKTQLRVPACSDRQIVHFRLGHVNVRAAAIIAARLALTAVGATQLALELDDRVLRKYLAVSIGASALVMLR